jgi:hypothetical protein
MNFKLKVFIFSCKMGRVDFFFLNKWSKSPPFFLNHHRVANYNIGLPMARLAFIFIKNKNRSMVNCF